MDAAQIPLMEEHVDILQVGARNMQNFSLLRALGRVRKPVLLKRGLAATVQEWLLAAEYLLEGGNEQVLLCERGIRTFETVHAQHAGPGGVALAKQRTHLPVIVDPSHATGEPDLDPAHGAGGGGGWGGRAAHRGACPARAGPV